MWLGRKLSTMEQLSIRSFQENGHEFHLYLYFPCDGVPANTVVKDANSVIPFEKIREYASIPNFSDAFRYIMIQKGYPWWVDLDVICLKPFDFKEDYIFTSEVFYGLPDDQLVNGCVLKAPSDSEFIKTAIARCAAMDTKHPTGKILDGILALGPELMTDLAAEFNLRGYVQPLSTFTPIACVQTPTLFLDPTLGLDLTSAYGVHMFHSQWAKIGTDGTHHPTCLYERLKSRYAQTLKTVST